MHYNHCHRAAAHLQLNILLLKYIIEIYPRELITKADICNTVQQA
jgi:hypothetical protein